MLKTVHLSSFCKKNENKTRIASSLIFVSSAIPSKRIPRPNTRRTPNIFDSSGADGHHIVVPHLVPRQAYNLFKIWIWHPKLSS